MIPKGISDAEFEREVLNSDGLVIVDFWAPWSRPCRVVLPMLEVFGERYNGQLKIVTLNVDEYPDLVKEFAVVRIPMIFFFVGGRVVDRAEGISSVKYLEARVQRFLPVPFCETDSETGHCGCGSV